MTKIKFIIFFFSFLVFSCNKKNEKIEDKLIGEWSKIESKLDSDRPFLFYRPFGIGFTEHKIEFFNGFKAYDQDTITRKRTLNYKGTFTDYKVKDDSIFILNPFIGDWEFKWKIKEQLTDTLILAKNDTTFIKLQRLKNKPDINFDQIIFSSSGCFGSCPVINISIDKKNIIYFQGEANVNPLGFYKSNIDSLKTKYIFSKFGKANINNLLDGYMVGHTDDQTIITTFIKNGQIVKTIDDYGKEGPKELLWAYVPLENLYTEIKLDSFKNNEQQHLKIHYLNFENSKYFLPIEKSESFFLALEINKSKIVTEKFNSLYSITYSQSRQKENENRYYEIDKIETDGRFFKFDYKDHESVTYDLGYNFVERNFKESDFLEHWNYN